MIAYNFIGPVKSTAKDIDIIVHMLRYLVESYYLSFVQLENGCSSNPCEEGTCNPTWSSFRCVCQPLVAGDNCEESK